MAAGSGRGQDRAPAQPGAQRTPPSARPALWWFALRSRCSVLRTRRCWPPWSQCGTLLQREEGGRMTNLSALLPRSVSSTWCDVAISAEGVTS